MITKYVLIVWIGAGQSQTLSIETFELEAECRAVVNALQLEMDRSGWYDCVPYTFERTE